MKKAYKVPSITSEPIKIGVFGCGGYGSHNKWSGGDGIRNTSQSGFGWWPFAAMMYRKRKN